MVAGKTEQLVQTDNEGSFGVATVEAAVVRPARVRKERAGNVCLLRCWQHTNWECVWFGHFFAEGSFILHASCV